MFGGLLLMISGACTIWLVYCFASMIDPEPQGAPASSEIWRKMTADGGGNIGFGILLLCVGIWMASRRPKSHASQKPADVKLE
jgi:hypothetical protein